MADDTGTFKVTDTYLQDFANHQLQNFLDDAAQNPAMNVILGFANGAGNIGGYNKIFDGNGNALPSAGQLQNAFKSLAGSLRTGIQGLVDTGQKTRSDLLLVDYHIKNSEDKASLTAEEMGQDLQDVLSTLNGSSSITSPSNNNTPPSTTGH